MALETIPENTTAYLTVSFFDKNGDPETPSTVKWLALDLFTNSILQEEIDATPGTSTEITIPAAVNTIVDENRPRETRRIIVKTTYGAGATLNQKYDYYVENLDQI